MDFGVVIMSNDWRHVRRAEELGFDCAWFFDSPMVYADPLVAMGAAATHTDTIRLSMGVAVPSNRLDPVTANALASLNKLAPNRIAHSVGTGFTARRSLGMPPLKLARLRAHVATLRGLLAGDLIAWEEQDSAYAIKFLHPELGLIKPDARIPIYISAMGPRSIGLAVEIGDGWLTYINGITDTALDAVAQVIDACNTAGGDPASFYKVAFVHGCVLRPGEAANSSRAKAQAGPLAASFLHAGMEGSAPSVIGPELMSLLARYRAEVFDRFAPPNTKYLHLHRLHLLAVTEQDDPFLTEDVMRVATFTATEDELVERLRTLERAGYDQFVINIPAGQEPALEDWARLFEKV